MVLDTETEECCSHKIRCCSGSAPTARRVRGQHEGDWGYAIIDTTDGGNILEIDRTGLGRVLCGGPEARFFGTLRRDDGRDLVVLYEDQCGLDDGSCVVVDLGGKGRPIPWSTTTICETRCSGPGYDDESDSGPYEQTKLRGIRLEDADGDGKPDLRVTLEHEKGFEKLNKRKTSESRTEEAV